MGIRTAEPLKLFTNGWMNVTIFFPLTGQSPWLSPRSLRHEESLSLKLLSWPSWNVLATEMAMIWCHCASPGSHKFLEFSCCLWQMSEEEEGVLTQSWRQTWAIPLGLCQAQVPRKCPPLWPSLSRRLEDTPLLEHHHHQRRQIGRGGEQPLIPLCLLC